MPLPASVRTIATEALRLPGHTIPVPGWFPLVVEPAHRRLGADPHPTVRVNGTLMRLDLDEYVQRRIIYGCHEIPGARFVRRLLRPGDRVLDVGANVGFFTLLAAACVGPGGRVEAMEPIPANADVLEENVRLNDFTTVHVTRSAAGDHAGDIRLGLDHPDLGEAGVSGHYTEGGARDALTVPVVPVDDVLRGAAPVRLVKIDVEGAEPRVLAGMARTLRDDPPDALLLEINPRALAAQGFRVSDMTGPLLEAGYALRTVTPLGRVGGPADVRDDPAPGAPGGRETLALIREGLQGRSRLESVVAVRGSYGRRPRSRPRGSPSG